MNGEGKIAVELPPDPGKEYNNIDFYKDKRLCYRTRYPHNYLFSDGLKPEVFHYIQYLKILWEEPENAFDPKNPPFIDFRMNYPNGMPKRNDPENSHYGKLHPGVEIYSIRLLGMHREFSQDLDDHLAQLPKFCPNLSYFYIEDQFMTEVPAWVLKFHDLNALGLYLPNLESLPSNFLSNFPKLRSLSLYTPKITSLPDNFDLTPNFRGIDLYCCPKITELPQTLISAHDLKSINIFAPTSIEITYSQLRTILKKRARLIYCHNFYYTSIYSPYCQFVLFEEFLRQYNKANNYPAPGRPIFPEDIWLGKI